jgi:outer membrane lipoprotein-sorting protein
MSRSMSHVAIAALAILVGAEAGAAPAASLDGDALLARVDAATTEFSDARFESRLVVRGDQEREYRFTTLLKRPGRRLVQFTAPAEVRGMGVLVVDERTMYVYLPGYDRVRRVGEHVRSQRFMGSDFSFEDVARTALAPTYTARRLPDERGLAVLELTAREGRSVELPRLRLWVDDRFRPARLDAFDAAGRLAKTITRVDEPDPSALEAGRIEAVDVRRGGRRSELHYRLVERDTGLSDDRFTVRALSRGQ